MTHDSSVNFKLMNFYFGRKDPINVPILTLSSALVKICQIPYVIFPSNKLVFLEIMHHSSLSRKTFFCTFLAQIILKWKLLKLSSAQVKVCQILMSILKRKVDSSPNFVSISSFMKDNSSVLFQLKQYILYPKGAH